MDEYISKTELLKVINTDIAEAHNERCVQLLNAILYATTADVVPKSEVEKLTVELDAMRGAANSYKIHYNSISREIFEEIEKIIQDRKNKELKLQGDNKTISPFTYSCNVLTIIQYKIAELKKKYLEEKE